MKIKTALVLGAGLGTRLRPLTGDTPKPMLPIGGRPLIERIFDNILPLGVERIIVNTHHCPEKYREHFAENKYGSVEIVFVHEPVLLDTGGTIKNIAPLLENDTPLFVHNGDILYEADFFNFAHNSIHSNTAVDLLLRTEGPVKNVAVKDGKVTDMRGLLNAEHDNLMQFTGVFIAKPKFISKAKEFEKDVFSTVDIFIELIKNGTPIDRKSVV